MILFLVAGILLIGLIKYFQSKRRNIATPPEKVAVVSETKHKPRKNPGKIFEYPKFIPYYRWHGWKNGLQPSTKQDILNDHKNRGLI